MDAIDPVADLRQRVKAAGLTMKDVCQRAGVATSTPSRWKNWAPKLATINRLNAALADLAGEPAAS